MNKKYVLAAALSGGAISLGLSCLFPFGGNVYGALLWAIPGGFAAGYLLRTAKGYDLNEILSAGVLSAFFYVMAELTYLSTLPGTEENLRGNVDAVSSMTSNASLFAYVALFILAGAAGSRVLSAFYGREPITKKSKQRRWPHHQKDSEKPR